MTSHIHKDVLQEIPLRNKQQDKLSWEDTFKTMAAENEDWSDFDITLLDGTLMLYWSTQKR